MRLPPSENYQSINAIDTSVFSIKSDACKSFILQHSDIDILCVCSLVGLDAEQRPGTLSFFTAKRALLLVFYWNSS
jgi:hypothetical protein